MHVKKKKTSNSRGVRQLFYPRPIINLFFLYIIYTHTKKKKKRSPVHKLNVVRLPPSLFFLYHAYFTPHHVPGYSSALEAAALARRRSSTINGIGFSGLDACNFLAWMVPKVEMSPVCCP